MTRAPLLLRQILLACVPILALAPWTHAMDVWSSTLAAPRTVLTAGDGRAPEQFADTGLSGTGDRGIAKIEAVDLEGRGEPKVLRLLGAIATICVLGVSAAIIRAIVSERTRS